MVTMMQFDRNQLAYIETLYKKKASLLYYYSKAIFNNVAIAEESVQETFIIACINYDKLCNSPNPEGWLMNVHKNVCRNIQKTQNYYLRKILSIDNVAHLIPYTEPQYSTAGDLESFVSKEDYIILKKIILEGYSHKELAAELNISIDACKKRFQRAKEHFRKNFRE